MPVVYQAGDGSPRGALRAAAESAAHSGFRPGLPDSRKGGDGGGAARPHSFLAWRSGRRWFPRRQGPQAAPAGCRAHVLLRPPAPSGAGGRRPLPEAEPRACGGRAPGPPFVPSAPSGRGPGRGCGWRPAVRGSQTLPHARGEEISTLAAIL